MRISPTGRCRSGFTLVELLVVIVVIGLSMGMVAPRLAPDLFRTDFDAAARRLSGTMSSARSRAMLSGEPWAMTFDLDADAYWIQPALLGAERGDAVRRVRLPEGVSVRWLEIGQRGRLLSGQNMLEFRPMGMTQPAVICLESDEGAVWIRVKPFNAHLEVHGEEFDLADVASQMSRLREN